MIRVNLLAQRRQATKTEGASQAWVAVLVVVTLLEAVGLFIFHGAKVEELDEQTRKNRELEAQIAQSKKSVEKHAEVREKLKRLREREEAIAKLESARSGPTSVLLELARLLTPGRGPSVQPERLGALTRDNPLAAHNPSWDTRRLWLLNFREEKRRMRIDGMARDGEDVSELARRMNLSNYFTAVRLLPAKRETDPKTKLSVVRFSLEAEVKY